MRLILGLIAGTLLAGCVTDQAKKEEEEAAKTTYVCLLEGERLVIRFDMGMARMLMPSGDRVDLYQIPGGGSGVRFSNGNMELRGKGIELVLIDETTGTQSVLTQCAPYSAPKQ
jgi:membrane-bound inhibitor of C-type lysozyme